MKPILDRMNAYIVKYVKQKGKFPKLITLNFKDYYLLIEQTETLRKFSVDYRDHMVGGSQYFGGIPITGTSKKGDL